MFTGMALRMAQELGLQRQRDAQATENMLNEMNVAQDVDDHPKVIDLSSFKIASEIVLFWSVYAHDVALCNGTGRVPNLKSHEINVRLPTSNDIAIIRAGPGGRLGPGHAEVYPEMARMMLLFAQSIDFLNTRSSQMLSQSKANEKHTQDPVKTLRSDMIREYRLIPRGSSFGAVQYQDAVSRGQAGPYLLLHLQYYLQMAFLAQESLAGIGDELSKTTRLQDERGKGDGARRHERETLQDLYKNSIKAITDMLTFAKLIDDRPLRSVVYLNQAFFHAACAYSRDMFESSITETASEELSPSAFPIPSQTSPSMVFPDYPGAKSSRDESKEAQQSAYNFLALIAKANYQFLRQAIKDQARFYAGSGWVDAVLDQREKGLRDVDLTIVSDSISTFIRLHDLREPGGSRAALQKVSEYERRCVSRLMCENSSCLRMLWSEPALEQTTCSGTISLLMSLRTLN